MKNIILASCSARYGEEYLSYLLPSLKEHFKAVSEVIFIPYARPGGISWDEYTQKATTVFKKLDIKLIGLHTFAKPCEAIKKAQAIFTGGGNTFLLLDKLYKMGAMQVLREVITASTPYLGTSAGSNIAGVNIKNTNDMPIVYPPAFEALGLIPFNINAHYLDVIPHLKHNGETRETRIIEYLHQNKVPVVGLREGSWLSIKGNTVTLEGDLSAKIFESIDKIYEVDPQSVISFNSK